jgi:hypothetical protein
MPAQPGANWWITTKNCWISSRGEKQYQSIDRDPSHFFLFFLKKLLYIYEIFGIILLLPNYILI